jgi:hypothetical protein
MGYKSASGFLKYYYDGFCGVALDVVACPVIEEKLIRSPGAILGKRPSKLGRGA